jgi:hypothetical protein
MHFSLAVLANLILLVNSFLVGMLLFTLLPVSVAILTLPLNAAIFIMWRTRLTIGSYLAAIHGVTFLFSVVFFVLIAAFGREHFEFLLDWV